MPAVAAADVVDEVGQRLRHRGARPAAEQLLQVARASGRRPARGAPRPRRHPVDRRAAGRLDVGDERELAGEVALERAGRDDGEVGLDEDVVERVGQQRRERPGGAARRRRRAAAGAGPDSPPRPVTPSSLGLGRAPARARGRAAGRRAAGPARPAARARSRGWRRCPARRLGERVEHPAAVGRARTAARGRGRAAASTLSRSSRCADQAGQPGQLQPGGRQRGPPLLRRQRQPRCRTPGSAPTRRRPPGWRRAGRRRRRPRRAARRSPRARRGPWRRGAGRGPRRRRPAAPTAGRPPTPPAAPRPGRRRRRRPARRRASTCPAPGRGHLRASARRAAAGRAGGAPRRARPTSRGSSTVPVSTGTSSAWASSQRTGLSASPAVTGRSASRTWPERRAGGERLEHLAAALVDPREQRAGAGRGRRTASATAAEAVAGGQPERLEQRGELAVGVPGQAGRDRAGRAPRAAAPATSRTRADQAQRVVVAPHQARGRAAARTPAAHLARASRRRPTRRCRPARSLGVVGQHAGRRRGASTKASSCSSARSTDSRTPGAGGEHPEVGRHRDGEVGAGPQQGGEPVVGPRAQPVGEAARRACPSGRG